jgi:light-regulated signal transduction histidine kinase (bacteriophytochrome)
MNFDWDSFLRRVIHDARAILRQAGTKTQLLDRRWDDVSPELRALLREAISAQANLDLFLRRIGAYHEALNSAPAGLLPVATIAKLAHLSRKDRLASAGAELQIGELGETVGPACLQTVLEELLDNSITFPAPERPVRVLLHASSNEEQLKVSFTDNASGWDPNFADRAFLPLEKLDPRGGFGLGLAIARALVDRAGGTITATTDPAGSTFTIEFPRSG